VLRRLTHTRGFNVVAAVSYINNAKHQRHILARCWHSLSSTVRAGWLSADHLIKRHFADQR